MLVNLLFIYVYLKSSINLVGEKPKINLSGYGIGRAIIRVYEVPHGYEFFKKSSSILYPTIIEKGKIFNTFESIEKGIKEARKKIRNYFRRNIKTEERREITENFKIKKLEEEVLKFPSPLKEYELIEEWIEDFGQTWISKDIEINVYKKGVYIVEVSNAYSRKFIPLIITDIGFITKQDRENFYLFAQNLFTSEPLKGANVCIKLNEKTLKEGKTDENGIFYFKMKEVQSAHDFQVILSYNGSIALSTSYAPWAEFPPERIYIYTDRPLYRPNDKVFFKIVARILEEENYRSYTGSLRVKILNPKDNILYDKELNTNEFGTCYDSLILPENANLGTYRINANFKDKEFSQIFKVEAYRKPEFSVKVDVEPKVLTTGEKAKIKIKGEYFFGAPVSQGKVKLKISRRPFYYDHEFYEYTWEQEFLDEIEGNLNERGELVHEYEIQEIDRYYTYIVDVSLEDESGLEQREKGFFKAGRSKYYTFLTTDKYSYKKGEEIEIYANVIDLEGKGLKEGNVKIKIFEKEYDIKIKEGKGILKVKAVKAGWFKIAMEFKDEKEFLLSSHANVYVYEEGYTFEYEENRIEIITEKKEYIPGERLKAIIFSPFERGYLFYTIENYGIEKVGVVRIEKNTGIIEFKIKEIHIPNFHISISGNRKLNFYEAKKEIKVNSESKRLNITFELEKKRYLPQEKAKIKVKVNDYKGKPQESEISIFIVDEALFSLQRPLEEDIFFFFYPQKGIYSSCNSSSSWNFWEVGYLFEEEGVRKKDFLYHLAKKDLETYPRFAMKGIGEEMMIRKEFKDLAFCVLRRSTDKNGEAEFEIKLPDNLTTWRIRVKAKVKDKFGEEEHKFIVSKDLLARLILPRFLRERDTVEIKGIVHNYQDKKDYINFQIDARGVELLGKEDVSVGEVLPGGLKSTNFKVYAAKPGIADFTLIAKGKNSYDALNLKIPILPHGMEKILSISNILKNDKSEIEFEIPEDIENFSSALYISPSYQNAVFSSLKELIGYPYGCVEQTMSKFLPNVAVKDIIEKAGVKDPLFTKELPKMIEKGLQRLYTFQHADGGWGWWENDESHPFNTAYVLYGLGLLKRTGYRVNDEVIQKGVKKLKEFLEQENLSDYDKAFLLYSLSFYERIKKEDIEKYLVGKIESPYIISLISLILSQDKKQGEIYFSKLKEMAINVNGVSYFQDMFLKSNHGTIYADPLFVTSKALLSSLYYIPNDEFCTRLSFYLLNKRKGAMWHSTITTSSTIISLGEYMEKRGLFDFDLSLNLKINDRNFGNYTIKRENINEYNSPKIIPTDILSKGKNKIVFEKSGKGEILYSFFVKYYSTEENIKAGGAEFKVLKEIWRLQPIREGNKIIYKKIPFYGYTKKGEYLFVKIKVQCNSEMEYFMLEDPLPAGCEVEKERERFYIEGESKYRGDYYYDYDGWDWDWIGEEIHDDRIAFFRTRLYPGTYEFSYILRTYLPGRFHVMPAKGSLMYFPDIFAHSDEYVIKISE
ncbi:MAG: MG2 domain-containing protein [Candidatus Hydrothermales bacterium]